MGSPARFYQVLLLVKNVPSTTEFFSKGLGLQVFHRSETWAEVADSENSARIAIKSANGEAMATTGYSPFLNFVVDDMDSTMQNVMTMGATMDGPIKYPWHGKIASIRTPDGHMLGLYEPGPEAPKVH